MKLLLVLLPDVCCRWEVINSNTSAYRQTIKRLSTRHSRQLLMFCLANLYARLVIQPQRGLCLLPRSNWGSFACLANVSHKQTLTYFIYLKLRTMSQECNIQTWFKVQDHVQSLAVVWNLLIEPSQVEFVLDVVFIHLSLEKPQIRLISIHQESSSCENRTP